MNTLVKWPGGKAREIKYIEGLIPPFERYCEPFFGGGALYFYLRPRQALINDISPDLTEFYRLVKAQDPVFYACLCAYDHLLTGLLAACDARGEELLALYGRLRDAAEPEAALASALYALAEELAAALPETDKRRLAVKEGRLAAQLRGNGADKLRRTLKNEKKVPFSREDQRRLAEALGRTRARFLLVIKNTDFIHSLYADRFHILSFDKTYAYNVRSRNDRSAEHLIIANYPVK